MLNFYEDYLERLGHLHAKIELALKGLPQEALDWIPGPEMNPPGALVAHIAGAENYWIGEVVGKTPCGRNREAEFTVRGLRCGQLLDLLEESMDCARRVFAGLTLADLQAGRLSPRSGHYITTGWALLHALEHTGIHLGDIQITRQLWEQRGKA